AALVRGEDAGDVARIDDRTGDRGIHGEGETAVVLQWAEQRIDVRQITADQATRAAAIPDQVRSLRADGAFQVRTRGTGVVGDNGVLNVDGLTHGNENPAAGNCGRVAGDGIIVEGGAAP